MVSPRPNVVGPPSMNILRKVPVSWTPGVMPASATPPPSIHRNPDSELPQQPTRPTPPPGARKGATRTYWPVLNETENGTLPDSDSAYPSLLSPTFLMKPAAG